MPETTFHGTEESQQKRMVLKHTDTAVIINNEGERTTGAEINKRQFTLTENDLNQLDEMSLFNEQLDAFTEQLNIDKEISPKVVKQEPKQEEKKVDIDAIKLYVQKCLARQDLVNSLASMENDFYVKAALVTNQINESSLFQLDEFISTRLDNIIHNSKEYSENITTRLTDEELELYKKLCKDVEEFKRMLYEKLGITR